MAKFGHELQVGAQSEGRTMSMLFAATYPKCRRTTRQPARNDLDTIIRAPAAGNANDRSRQTIRAGQ